MHVAMLGTRGIPARYGGFETAIEEIGPRLVERGLKVTVYCRPDTCDATEVGPIYRGCHRVVLPGVRSKALETLSQTGLSVTHLASRRPPDVAVVFNAANAVFLPALRARGVAVATHVDGLEWKRAKWSQSGRTYYRRAEEMAVRWSDALIADARGIAAYYQHEFDVPTEQIAYGARILRGSSAGRVASLGLQPGRYHLVVARFEPENHVDMIIGGYLQSRARHDLVVVGSAPYAPEYTARIAEMAAGDRRVRLLGSIWDQDLLDELYANAATYVHGHSVGGTNPSLLRSMGAGAPVLAFDVSFNRDVLGPQARCFATASDLALQLQQAEARPEQTRAYGLMGQERAATNYCWDEVAAQYGDLIERLAAGYTIHGPRRRRSSSGSYPGQEHGSAPVGAAASS